MCYVLIIRVLSMVVVSIYIQPYLVEYMRYKYPPSEKSDFIQISDKDDLYFVLNNLRMEKPKDALVNRGNFKFAVPSPRNSRNPEIYNHYSQKAIKSIESRINRMFRAEFHDFMDHRVDECGDSINEANILFCKIYKITEIDPESLKKDYYRWRKKHRANRKIRPYNFQAKQA